MSTKVVQNLHFNGMSPQKAIRHLTGLINSQKEGDKRWLRIEEYDETYGHPFADGVKALRLIIDKPNDKKEPT